MSMPPSLGGWPQSGGIVFRKRCGLELPAEARFFFVHVVNVKEYIFYTQSMIIFIPSTGIFFIPSRWAVYWTYGDSSGVSSAVSGRLEAFP